MAGSSPLNHHLWSSPSRTVEEILAEDRNSEARHRYLLELARKEHERVREEAARIYREQLAREERERLLAERRKEEERIRLEQQIAAENARLNALKATRIEIPPLLPDPVPAPSTVNGKPTLPAAVATEAKRCPSEPSLVNGIASNGVVEAPAAASIKTLEPAKPAASAFKAAGSATTAAPVAPIASVQPSTNGVVSAVASTPKTAPPAPTETPPDRYVEIHRNLKGLRKYMAEQAKTNLKLKQRMGDMRREIRKSVGQLTTGGMAANKDKQQKIKSILTEALSNQVESALVDPNNFVVEPRKPVEGATNNDPLLPSIFVYLINIFAKAAISQFINEAGARPETADPVGICVAAILSEPDFLWRGASLIDILIAKFRIVCPVLFGYRGSEKTEQGRQRLGWWKESGQWISEQQHMDRMTGLGAGFAAISLRKFALSKKQNPYPPRFYWMAMAKIVNTPPAEISNTQCVVLKAMVQNYEAKFIEFYGSAAIAALRTALIDFPARAPHKSAAVNSLEVLAQMLKRDTGLDLG